MTPSFSNRFAASRLVRGLGLPLAAAPGILALLLPLHDAVVLQRRMALLGLFALLPLIAIYLLVPEQVRARVASLALWRTLLVRRPPPPRFRLRPFWRELGFWLWASLLILLTVAAALPVFNQRARDPGLLILLDRSATMATSLPGVERRAPATRDAQAQELARRLIAEADGAVGLLAQSSHSQVVITPRSPQAVLSALPLSTPCGGWGQLPTLLSQGRQVLDGYGGPLRIVLISDNVDGNAERSLQKGPLSAACAAGWCSLLVPAVGEHQQDAALVDAPARVTAELPFDLHLVSTSSSARTLLATLVDKTGDIESYSRTIGLLPGRNRIEQRLPKAGCWRLQLDGKDDLAADDTLFVQSASAGSATCLIADSRRAASEPPVASWLTAAGVKLLGGESAEAYDFGAVTDAAAACSLMIFVNPEGKEEILALPEVEATSWLAIYLSSSDSTFVSSVSREIPPLAELEPRLFSLAPLRPPPLSRLHDAHTLIRVYDGKVESPAVVRYGDGQRTRTLVSLRWPPATDRELAITSAMVTVLSLWQSHANIPAQRSLPQRPSSAYAQPVCPAQGQQSEGLYTVQRAAAARAGKPEILSSALERVTALAPDLESLVARRSVLPNRPVEGRTQIALSPLLLALAWLLLGIEQLRRLRQETSR